MGADFQMAPNPRVVNRLPDSFRLKGPYFHVREAEGEFVVTPQTS
jgi:hypothetical protein